MGEPQIVVVQGVLPSGWRQWVCWLYGHKAGVRTGPGTFACPRCRVEVLVSV